MGDDSRDVPEDDQLGHSGQRGTDSSKASVLLIPGASLSGREWLKVIPHLETNYNVLMLRDPTEQGDNQNTEPFSKEDTARRLADLIHDEGTNGRAHVVGHSLGAHVAVELASKYPEVVDKVFTLAYGLYIQDSVASIAPKALIRWLTDDTDLPASTTAPSLASCKAVASVMCPGEDGWPQPWPATTLIIAAGKSGLLPTADHPHDARRLRDIGRKANEATVAYTHPEMRHPWNLQAPELYAQTVTQWVEEGTVPDGFKIL
ncbi:uncharacterized protein LTR77_002421 [Saxophila tyrrhenica]|uniref:AB hydrolase-1 domain-containing protein n=1 Tax=Saxophila tyrrhenica TaxID=1690608 RepID=A0AAV9PLM4_9PEZI|nr:hypothetical protein LTR77_002421 [Saxophila tyrrhenica]